MINKNSVSKFDDNSAVIRYEKICDDAFFFK